MHLIYRKVIQEVNATFLVNFLFSIALYLPLWYTGSIIKWNYNILSNFFPVKQINDRQSFLKKLIGTKGDEDVSFEAGNYIWAVSLSCFFLFSVLEVLFFNLYNSLVRFLKIFLVFYFFSVSEFNNQLSILASPLDKNFQEKQAWRNGRAYQVTRDKDQGTGRTKCSRCRTTT